MLFSWRQKPRFFYAMVRKKNSKIVDILSEDLILLEEYARELLLFCPLPLLISSPTGVVLETNRALENLTGRTSHELIGEPIEKIFQPDVIGALLSRVVSGEDIKNKEILMTAKLGGKRPVSFFAKRRENSKQELTGCFIGIFDLIEVKKYQNELKQKIEELQKMHQVCVDRELKMIQLKEKISEMERKREAP